MLAAMAVINNLIGDGNVRRNHFFSNATHGGNRNNLFNTSCLSPRYWRDNLFCVEQ